MCYHYGSTLQSFHQDGIHHSTMKKQRRATTIRLQDQDREALAAIREHYGVVSDNDVIRIALRELLRAIKKEEKSPHLHVYHVDNLHTLDHL